MTVDELDRLRGRSFGGLARKANIEHPVSFETELSM
jgi:hypothetical protein